MNIQTERLEDQTARVTVQVDAERLDAAKRRAAQQISRKVNIPGFRKGHVPYRVLVNYVGDAAITEDAVELLSEEVYREMLPETDLEPYGPGALEDVKSDDPTPTFVYIVPLQPDVDLKDYRSIRLPYSIQPVDDDAVKRAMRNLQEQEAVVEESQQPAALSNRLTLDLHSFILDEHEDEEDADADEAELVAAEAEADVAAEDAAVDAGAGEQGEDDAEAADEHDHEHEHHHHDDDGTPYIHEHDLQLILDEDDEPTPGFNEAMLGATAGDHREFVLTFPDDAEKYQDMAGKTVKYYVDVKKVETLTLPDLTDDFAARVTKDEEKPLTLLELRMRVRENLERVGEDNYRNEYVRQALDQIVDQSEIKFPEAMVADQVDRFLQDLDQRLRQQGITLQDYMKIYQKTPEDMYNDYRENAAQTVRRSLVLRELADLEGLVVTDAHVDAQINRITEQFGEEQRDTIRQMFTSQPSMRDSVRSDLLRDQVLDRIIEIARGNAPEVSSLAAEPEGGEEADITTTDAGTDAAPITASAEPDAADTTEPAETESAGSVTENNEESAE